VKVDRREAAAPDIPDCVRLELPVDSRYMRVVRLVASGLGATVGFDVEAVDDFRIAVDELCAAMLEVSNGSSLDLSFEVRDDGIEVNGQTRTDPTARLNTERFALSEQILRVAADRYTVNVDGGTARFTVYKRV
jgi:serine/threonine-protein kinase RsbW